MGRGRCGCSGTDVEAVDVDRYDGNGFDVLHGPNTPVGRTSPARHAVAGGAFDAQVALRGVQVPAQHVPSSRSLVHSNASSLSSPHASVNVSSHPG